MESGIWNLGILESWNLGIMESWNHGILESWNLGIMESFYLYWRNLKMQFFPFEGCEGVDYLVMLFHKTFVTELFFHILQKEQVTLKITAKITLYTMFLAITII